MPRSRGKAQKLAMALEHHGDRCWLCGGEFPEGVSRTHPLAATLDHVVPKTEGGTDHNTNLRPAHKRCNQQRRHGYPDVVTFGGA